MRKMSLLIAFLVAVVSGGWILSGQPWFISWVGAKTGIELPEASPSPTQSAAGATLAQKPVQEPTQEATDTDQADANQDVAQDIQRVQTVTSMTRNYLAQIRLTGESAPSRTVALRAETNGRVARVKGNIGDLVRAGTVLVALDLDGRPAKLAQAQAFLKQAEIESEAAGKLASKGFQSDVRRLEAEATLARARAELDAIERDMQKTAITAPFDAIISARHVEIGDYLTSGDTTIELADLDPVLVSAQIPERDYGRIQNQAPVQLKFIGQPLIDARVTRISPVSDQRTRSFRIEIETPNPDIKLAAGMTVGLDVSLTSSQAHKISPAWLTLNNLGQVGIKSVGPDDIVLFHPVSILSDRAEGMWVTGLEAPLPETLDVISVGQEFAGTGTRVLPTASLNVFGGALDEQGG